MYARSPESVPTIIMAQGTFYIIADVTFIVRKGYYINIISIRRMHLSEIIGFQISLSMLSGELFTMKIYENKVNEKTPSMKYLRKEKCFGLLWINVILKACQLSAECLL